MTKISLVLSLFLIAGCIADSRETRIVHDNYHFDTAVVQRILVYDSLLYVILENYPTFQSHIQVDESYKAYRYEHPLDSIAFFKILTGEGAVKINKYFTLLGPHFFYGFDLFKDSSIKIYIRKSLSAGKHPIDIRENLSWYPPGTKMKQREFPVKDTVLNKSWQYWISFDKRELF